MYGLLGLVTSPPKYAVKSSPLYALSQEQNKVRTEAVSSRNVFSLLLYIETVLVYKNIPLRRVILLIQR